MKKTVLGAMVVAVAALTSNAYATSGYDKKFYISSDDGAYSLSPGLMINGWWKRSDKEGTITDAMELKKARLWFKGNWTDAFSYELTYEVGTVSDFYDTTNKLTSNAYYPYLKYANITHNLGAVKLRFGLQKVYLGGDHSESSTMNQFADGAKANSVGKALMAGQGDPAGGLAVLGEAGSLNYTLGIWENNLHKTSPTGSDLSTNGYDLSVAVDYTALGKMSKGMSDLTGERAVTVGAGMYYNNSTPGTDINYQALWIKYKGGGWSFGFDYDMGTSGSTKSSGMMARVGKVFSENQEVAFRYDTYDADTDASGADTTMALAYNYFFNGENAKLLVEYDMNTNTSDQKTNTTYVKYHVMF